jgi:TatD DNase family protein
VLHNRQSTDDLVAILRQAGKSHRGVVHSFLGDAALAETFLALGLYLGVGGPLTYPANEALRDAVRRAPLDRLVLETDCPYLTPVPHRGKRNEPAYVEFVAAEIARLRDISIDEVARQTTANALALFSLG